MRLRDFWTGDITARELWVRIKHLPPESALAARMQQQRERDVEADSEAAGRRWQEHHEARRRELGQEAV